MTGTASGELEVEALTTGATATAGVQISDLSQAETTALLARLGPLPGVTTNDGPVIRPASARPPGPGKLEPISFLAPTGSAVQSRAASHGPPVAAALAAPQILPVGEVEEESEIRVRFAEPMVAVDKLGEAPALATFEPAIAGSWKWIDTRIAVFTASAQRLAQATEYKVTVKPGIKALGGAVLDTAVTGTFSTPPVSISSTFPYGPQRDDAPIAVQFSQAIDPSALLPLLHVRTAKGALVPFQEAPLATARAAWAKNPRDTTDHDELGSRYVLLAPRTRWPAGTTLTVTLDKHAPSHEGPRLAKQASSRTFTVAPRFRMLGVSCDDDEKQALATSCSAQSLAAVVFTTPIDAKQFRAEMVQLAGEPLRDTSASGNTVHLVIPEREGKTFEVDVRDELRDAYGQPLDGPHRASITTSRFVYSPELHANTGLYVLDPRYQIPQYVVESQALQSMRIELYKVQPSDYFAYQQFEEGKRKMPPGKRISGVERAVGDRYAATERLDLRPALEPGGTGQVIVVTHARLADKQKHPSWVPTQTSAWIQVTKLGVVSRVDEERVHAWVDNISHANFLQARPNVSTSLVIQSRPEITTTATTDVNGEVTLELPAAAPKRTTLDLPENVALVVARDGADSVFTAIDRNQRSERVRNAEWYATDDRFTYKPDEPVYVKGWVRWTHDGVNPSLELPAAGDELAYVVTDARSNKIASGKTTFTDQGGFDFQFALPKNTNLGYATISMSTKDQEYSHRISVQEFRTPAYAVNLNDDVQASGVTPLFLGDAIEMNAEATYYAGGGLGGAKITWDAKLEHASYKPPGWDRYSFEPVTARHRAYEQEIVPPVTASATTTLGGGSNSRTRLALHALPAAQPAVLSVDATVTDVDRQTIRASSRSILVHPANLYVGMRLMPGTFDKLEVVVTDLDGTLVPDVAVDVKLEATLYTDARFANATIRDTQACAVKSGRAPTVCSYSPKRSRDYYYRAVATIYDARGRKNTAQYWVPYYNSRESTEALSITADREMYAAGETAKLMIQSTEVPATAVVSVSRQGVIEQHRLELRTHDTPFELAIDVSYLENVYVEVDRIAKRKTEDSISADPLPAHMEASINLKVDLDASRLQVKARPRQPVVGPGDQATFDVEITRDNKPVANAEVALIVVDEAVLALSGMHHPDPMAPFYQPVAAGTTQVNTFDTVADEDTELLGVPGYTRINLDEHGRFGTLGHGSGSGTGYGVGSGHGRMTGQAGSSVVSARKDFRATAIFAPRLHTDAKGHATISVKMPESLTRFRIVALATSKTYFFGKGEGSIVTQRKVNARTQAPRFLDQGDRFELPVVIQNLDSTTRTMQVAVRAANLVGGGLGKRVVVPAGQRAEVRFPFATAAHGKAVIQTIVTSGELTDASNVTVPVYVPATTESFATYGTLDKDSAYEQLNVPGDIFQEVGGVETEVASTQLQTLTDAYWYLRGYPFECAEQRSSRMLATAAMGSVLGAFALPERPTASEQAEVQRADVANLEADQNADGGWGYWRDTKSDPFVTMQVATALHGLGSSAAVQNRARSYIAKLLGETNARLAKAKPLDPVQYEVSLAATALTALVATGLDEKPAAQRLHTLASALEVYPVDAKARLLAIVARAPAAKVMRTRLVSDLISVTHETAAGATVTSSYTEAERLLLVSSNRTTALALDALIREVPEQPLIMKLARSLLAARAYGRWRSTQENLAVLQAMRRYFDTYEKDVPNYTGKLWIGDVAYAERTFQGRTNVRASAKLDWTKLVPGSQHTIAVEKTGPGRMYYRIGITYAPKKIDLPALDAGFVVRRSYEAVDDPKDVEQTPTGYRITLGARVLVVVEALNTTRRDGVALVDPLPAGLEAVNPNLAIAERAAKGAISRDWVHLETRDDRTEAFAGTLAEGSHVLSYTARATTPGTFNAAPAKAEEMYSPETFGRSQGAIVTVY
ncbi:hypothetical protein BH11MYX1_BH11MYX1_19780 [soil metagenome]